jgi:hypothetical protein
MLGYIFYGLTLIITFAFAIFNASKPSLSGENAMGYGLGLAFWGLVFTISSFVLTIIVGRKNGFDWVAVQSGSRILLVAIGWLCVAVAVFACAAFKWEWHEGEFPNYLHWIAKNNGQLWIPLLMLVPYFFLLDADRKAAITPFVYKLPLILNFMVSVIISLSVLWGYMQVTSKNQKAQIEQHNADEQRLHDEHMKRIVNHKQEDGILNIVVFTGRYHDEDIRTAAVAKIKENPSWEADLIDLINNVDYHTEAYTFIDGNMVDHPELFLTPINNSILRLADEIKGDITDSNNLQDWHFDHYSIDRLLRAIDDQFSNKGQDFRPSLVKLQSALRTSPPERFKGIKFNASKVVDDWLAKHK